jgi:hypothetical protein
MVLIKQITCTHNYKSWRKKYKLNLWTQFNFKFSFFTNHLKFYTLLCTSLNKCLKDLENIIIIFLIWDIHGEENSFQSLNVGKIWNGTC